jgi:hypothetical protein
VNKTEKDGNGCNVRLRVDKLGVHWFEPSTAHYERPANAGFLFAGLATHFCAVPGWCRRSKGLASSVGSRSGFQPARAVAGARSRRPQRISSIARTHEKTQERTLVIRSTFDDGPDCLEITGSWQGTHIPKPLADRLAAMRDQVTVDQQVRLRVLRRRPA